MAEQPVSFMNKPMQAFSMEQKSKAVPAYTLEPQARTITVNRTVKDEIGFRVIPTQVEISGYMVRTLRGDSVFVSQDEVTRLKLDRNLVPLVMEGGDDTPMGAVQANAALSSKHQQALDILSKLVENDPQLVERLLAEGKETVAEDE
jgi:hypothetical protein